MLERGIPQSAILALTFTNKAAREMESRVKELTGKKLTSLTVSTFHAFGVKILREEIEALGYRKNFSIYDSTDRCELIKESLRECKLYGEKTDLKKMEALFSNVKIGRLKWGRAADTAANVADNIWEKAYNEYQNSLKTYNALDFDDLLALPINLFGEHPEILKKYRCRYRYIMVDEFQDTSLIQYRLLMLLADPSGGQSNICVVGDDDQSIYSWRGANYENLILFEKDFPELLEIRLEQNYRSTTTILDAANGLISHNTSRKGKTLWSGNGEGKPIELYYPADERAEAAFIAETIKKLRFESNLGYGDFGVLLRTNSQFDCIEEAFLAANIPYRVSGGFSFFERKEIRDILSYLRVIANHNDDVNLLRIINTPRRGIGKASIRNAAELAKKNHSSIYDALYRTSLAKQAELIIKEHVKEQGIEEFVDLIQSSRDEFLGAGKLSEKVRGLVNKIDYWGYLVNEHGRDEKKARWKYANIEYLIEMIKNWENDEDNFDQGLYAYLNRVSLLTRTDGEEDRSDASQKNGGKVNLSTIHAAKGLEFPVVFIAGAEEGIIPHERSLESEDGSFPQGANPVEEERRLFYVAITRAQDKLYITSCRTRNRREGPGDRLPSPFLSEIKPELIECHDSDNLSAGNLPAEEPAMDAEAFFRTMRERFAK
jgi:DNA helicase-2/ATP-dependent DNA helicase PcrA